MKMLFNKKVTTKSLMTLHMADNVTVAKQKERIKILNETGASPNCTS